MFGSSTDYPSGDLQLPAYRNAREFLDAVIQRYRKLSSYSDAGKSHRPNCRRDRLINFCTDYISPNNFRFNFESRHPYRRLRHLKAEVIVGCYQGTPYFFDRTYGSSPAIETLESIDLAIASATGISSGTAHTIGALLFPELSGFTLLDLRRIRFRRNRIIDGVPCISVSGLHPRGGRCTAWFGAHDLLLRRMVQNKFRQEELRTNIRVGHAIPEMLFTPPRINT
jgi:hypothetical protein